MKTTMKQSVTGTLFALLLTVGTVYAKGTEAKSFNAINNETTLQLEDWMTDESIWNATSNFEFTQETETDMAIENWMTNELVWDTNDIIFEDTEAEMELESWMKSEETWNIKDITVETKLSLEDWMLDSEVWN